MSARRSLDAGEVQAADHLSLLIRARTENSFVDFWGRLRSEAAEKQKRGGDEESLARRALEQNADVGDVDPDSDEAQLPDLVDVAAGSGVLDEVHAVLRSDARYRIWAHKPERREEWVKEYLEGLGGRKRTAWDRTAEGKAP